MSDLPIPCTIMRGGTSKALFFMDSDLPSDQEQRTQSLLRAFGSPDVRQIDGLGGADPLTSKLAIIRASTLPGVDIEYTFGQVSIKDPHIDFSANCGNISSAVGPFAIHKGLVAAVEPLTTVRVLNVNTRKMIISEVPVRNGEVVIEGDYQIDGVPGTGARIRLHFLDPSGSATGKLLPTGKALDHLLLEDGRKVDISIVDAGNPAAFVRADEIGLRGDELPAEIDSNPDALAILEEIRAKVSAILGFCATWRDAYQRYRSIPKIAFVAAPAEYRGLQGGVIAAESMDLRARVLSMGRLHKAYAVTAGIPTAVACRLPGSVVHGLTRPGCSTVRIGHPSGVLSLDVCLSQNAAGLELKEVVVGRTARRLMEGHVFLPAL